jgi:hypothetical protein
MAEAGALPPLETAAAAREKAKLRKVLGRFDLVLFTACAILGFEASWGVSRAFFEWVTLGAFGVMVLLGVVFWAIGARNIRRGLLAPAQIQQDAP